MAGYIRVRGLVLRNDIVIPCSETMAVMIKIKPGDLMVVTLYETTTQKYYFPGMVNLVKEFVECCICDAARVWGEPRATEHTKECLLLRRPGC